MFRVYCFLIGYALGHIQTAYILARLIRKIDIRDYGTGNPGTSNSLKVLGVRYALPTLIIDVMKSFAAFVICAAIYGGIGAFVDFSDNIYRIPVIIENPWLPGVYGSLGAIFGHMFPIYMRFKGGKGTACGVGLILALNGLMTAIILCIAVMTVFITKYITPSSTVSLIFLPVMLVLFDMWNSIPWGMEVVAVGYFITVFLIFRHKGTIRKLLNGKEKKLWQKTSPPHH